MGTDTLLAGWISILLLVSSSSSAKSDYGSDWGRTRPHVELGTEKFPCPPGLRARTEFWIRIFTEFGQYDKVLHDEEHPWIIYDVIDVRGLSPREVDKKVRQRVRYYRDLLGRLDRKPPAGHSNTERDVARLHEEFTETDKFAKAQKRLRTQTGIRESVLAGIERSGRYMPHIERTLAAHGVPPEVAYLPHVESSYNPDARSHAGAVGLWQFTKGTGRQYLKIQHDLDERRDPFASTEAAAAYLRNSEANLGSWSLAVVSYNYGLSGVMRAQSRLNTSSIERVLEEYDGPRFGFASQNFYCEFLAAIEIGMNPERYFGDVKTAAPLDLVEFPLTDYVKIGDLCTGFGVPKSELKVLNPALGRSHLSEARAVPKGYSLRLPQRIANPSDLYASIPETERHAREPKPKGHRVETGDTLSHIAQRYRVSVSELREVNGIHDADQIRTGQVLVIP